MLCEDNMNKHRPIRIAHITSQLGVGGLELQALELCRRLDKNRYKIFCCPLWPQYALQKDMEDAGVTVLRIHKRRSYDIGVIPRLVRFLKSERIDIVHTWIFTSNCWGRASAMIAGTPVVIGSERNVDDWKRFYHKWIDRTLARYSNVVLANSRAVRDFMTDREGIPAEKIRIIYNGLDSKRFTECSIARHAARQQFGLPTSATIVGTVANLSPWKDYPNLLCAARIVCDHNPNVVFAIVGAGRMELALREQSKSMNLDRNVFFLGSQRDIPGALKAFDMFVLPSKREGFANVILEAMASGLPVIATDVGGNSEAIVHGLTGFLVPAANSRALSEAVLDLVKDPGRCETMGLAGRERVVQSFSMEQMVQAYDRLYTELLVRTELGSRAQ